MDNKPIILSDKDAGLFMQMLTAKTEPNEDMKVAAARYKDVRDEVVQDETPAMTYTWEYVDEPPPQCPQCLGRLILYKAGPASPRLEASYRCCLCDYCWIPEAKRKLPR